MEMVKFVDSVIIKMFQPDILYIHCHATILNSLFGLMLRDGHTLALPNKVVWFNFYTIPAKCPTGLDWVFKFLVTIHTPT